MVRWFPRRSIASRARRTVRFWMLCVALLSTISAYGDTKGKLTGRVVDARNEGVIGANVLIVGTTIGAAANVNGEYVMLNVPAGVYSVRASAVGYQTAMTKNVSINAGQSTTLIFTLTDATINAGEVVTVAERPLVDTRQTSTVAILNKEEINMLPVQNLTDVVNLQAGVVDGHFRGGRAGEVQYQVDGVSVNNPYDNSSVLQLDRSVLQEVQVISGAFDAEYGQAMSGVVNAVLRSGSDDHFEAGAEVYGGDYVVDAAGRDAFPFLKAKFPPTSQSYTAFLGGPAGLPRTSFLVNVRYFKDDGYLYGERRFLPGDATDFAQKIFRPTGDGAIVPMQKQEEFSGQFKLSNRSLEDIQLTYQAIGSVNTSHRFNFGFRLNPDGLTQQKQVSLVHGLDWTHTITPTTYYTLSLRQNYFRYTDYAFESIADSSYYRAGPPRSDANYELGAVIQGYDFGRFQQTTDTYLVKGSFTSQVTPLHLVKAGFEIQTSRIIFGAPGTLGENIIGNTAEVYVVPDSLAQNLQTFYPRSMAAYIQDRMEVVDFRINAGVRAEYYDANATVPSNLENPANAIQGAPLSSLQRTTVKIAVAPRLGVSYPISAGGALYFSYGHFYQMPGFGMLYANSDYTILRNLQAGAVTYATRGNPDIKPEFTVQYEFGFKQQFGRFLGVDLSAFYKDIRDLLGVEFIDTYADARYSRFTNVDFGSVGGIKLAVDQRLSATVAVSLNYTYQTAMGNSSDPNETANRAAAGADSRPRKMPFDWDQRHTLNLYATVSVPDDYSATVILRYGSGSPYTPAIGSNFGATLETNSAEKPAWATVDLRAEKFFSVADLRLNLFARVFNLFDTRYENGFVFSTTGSPNYSLIPAADRSTLIDPSRFAAPRRIELGVGIRM
jgi:outer membrane receptor protein involved in Fe transport